MGHGGNGNTNGWRIGRGRSIDRPDEKFRGGESRGSNNRFLQTSNAFVYMLRLVMTLFIVTNQIQVHASTHHQKAYCDVRVMLNVSLFSLDHADMTTYTIVFKGGQAISEKASRWCLL